MRAAIEETERRRNKQLSFNAANGIVPKGVVKRIKDIIDGVYNGDALEARHMVAAETARYETMSERDLGKEIKRLEREMIVFARNLEFERAAQSRDELFRLRQRVFGADQHGTT